MSGSTSARISRWPRRSPAASGCCAPTAGSSRPARCRQPSPRSAAAASATSRCRSTLRIEEEYLPALDLASGRPLPTDDEPDVARLTDHHELDLETPVREAIQLAEPIAPLCRPDCPGLCIVCGERLEDGVHDHPDDDIDPRLEALRGFTADDT